MTGLSDLFKPKRALNASSREPLSLPEGFTVTCHAGAMGTKANTIASLRVALEWGAQVVEMDVTFRPDSTPCVIHKTKPAAGEGTDFDKALATIAAGSDSCKVNLDLKAYENLPEVDRLVEKHGLMSRAFYTGVDEKNVERVRTTSVIPYYLNANTDPKRRNDALYAKELAEKIKALGAVGLNTQFLNVTKTVNEVLHAEGLLVSAWTANSMPVQCELLRLGVDNITTRKPGRLKYCIEHWGGF